MRKFIIIWSVALTVAALVFFYEMRLLTNEPIVIHLLDVVVIGGGAAISAVFSMWALRLSPRVYRLVITGIGVVIWVFAVFIWLSNILFPGIDVHYLSVVDFIVVLAIGTAVGYGIFISIKKRK